MVCKKCGNQLNDNAQFCPRCGQKTETQMQDISRNVQPNTNNVNPAGNVNSEAPPKKKHTVRTVLLSVVATIVVMFGGLIWLGSQAPDSVETGGSSVSAPSEHSEISSDISSQDAVSSTVSSQDSIDELFGYIDQAGELADNMSNEVDKVFSESDKVEAIRKIAGYIENLYQDAIDLQEQAGAISGLDATLAAAEKDYFDILCNSFKTLYETYYFVADFGDFANNFLITMPIEEGYTSIEEYYNALYSWYQSAKEGYAAVGFCPPCMESEWKQLGDTLDLNDSIVQKLYWAVQDGDYLRLYSARNMSNRYLRILRVRMDKMSKYMDSIGDNLNWQVGFLDELMDEMYEYASLEEKDRKEYQFTNRSGEIALDYEAADTIYPSLYSTYDAFLIIKANCISGNRKIIVEAEIPGFTQKYQESFVLNFEHRSIYIKPPALTGDLDLTAAKDAQINVTVSDQDGTVIETKSFPTTIKSKYDKLLYTDEYGVSTKDNALCWLTPESSAMTELRRVAIDEMFAMTDGEMESFIGYQGGIDNTYMQIAGIMRAMYAMGVRYNMDPFSLDEVSQHVFFPEDVLSQKSGLCIETALTVASALQSAGMHVFLICPPGHAQVAVETGTHTGQYLLVETTFLSDNTNNQDLFRQCLQQLRSKNTLPTAVKDPETNAYQYMSPIMFLNSEQWQDYLSVEGTYVIDCDDSTVLGLTPFAN